MIFSVNPALCYVIHLNFVVCLNRLAGGCRKSCKEYAQILKLKKNGKKN